jgi:hypothetical protein
MGPHAASKTFKDMEITKSQESRHGA